MLHAGEKITDSGEAKESRTNELGAVDRRGDEETVKATTDSSSSSRSTTDSMANRGGREALRGAEEETFDLLAKVLTSRQWAESLEAPLERVEQHQGNTGLAQKKKLAGADRREAVRGAEGETFDLLAQVLTSKQWAELLQAPLKRAAATCSRGLARKLVRAGAAFGDSLHEAIRGGAIRIRCGAIRGGDEDIVSDLLEDGASVGAKEDSRGYTPLHVAAEQGRTESLQLLLLKGADIEALCNSGGTPLYLAVCSKQAAAALALVAAGANVHFRFGPRKGSVLHMAVYWEELEIIRAVIERGADVNAVNTDQSTPLHVAAIHNRAKAIDVLAEAGANLEARQGEGLTPLLRAACGRPHLQTLSALLKYGANVNAQQNRRETSLFLAAKETYDQQGAEAVTLLLRAGADETILNEEGRSAVDVVAEGEDEEFQVAEYVEHVRQLLAKAPADRAWRRRGYLVLCRARPDVLRQIQDSSSARPGMAGTTLCRETSDCSGAVESSAVDERCGGDWAVVLAVVLGLQEEGIFRRIVGYL